MGIQFLNCIGIHSCDGNGWSTCWMWVEGKCHSACHPPSFGLCSLQYLAWCNKPFTRQAEVAYEFHKIMQDRMITFHKMKYLFLVQRTQQCYMNDPELFQYFLEQQGIGTMKQLGVVHRFDVCQHICSGS